MKIKHYSDAPTWRTTAAAQKGDHVRVQEFSGAAVLDQSQTSFTLRTMLVIAGASLRVGQRVKFDEEGLVYPAES